MMDNLDWKRGPEVVQSNAAQSGCNGSNQISAVSSQVLNISKDGYSPPLRAAGLCCVDV